MILPADDPSRKYNGVLESPNAVRNHSLCGFQRIHLKAGEKKTVTIPVPEKAFTAVDEKGERKVESSRFDLYVGTSQPDSRSVELTGQVPVRLEVKRGI